MSEIARHEAEPPRRPRIFRAAAASAAVLLSAGVACTESTDSPLQDTWVQSPQYVMSLQTEDEGSFGCSAVHIGGGWLVSAAHCVDEGYFRPPESTSGPYDLTDDVPPTHSAWVEQPVDSGELHEVGVADAIILPPDPYTEDFMLLHVSDAEAWPAIPVSDSPPQTDETYRVRGFGQPNRNHLVINGVRYMGRMVLDGPNHYPLRASQQIFAIDPEADRAACELGMSGGALEGSTGLVAVVSMTLSNARQRILEGTGNPQVQRYENFCSGTPVTRELVKAFRRAA